MKKTYHAPLTEKMSCSIPEIICTSLLLGGKAADSGVTEADVHANGWDIWNDDELLDE